METFKSFNSKIYTVNDTSFTDIAFEIFQFQATHNPLYEAFIKHLGLRVREISTLEQIPFLPISLFKTKTIKTGKWDHQAIFTSSGTTTSIASSHFIADLQFYLAHSKKCFEHFFGSVTQYHFLALLPSYLERQGSSLVAMMNYFIENSNSPHSAFYLTEHEKLMEKLQELKNDSRKAILWGVSFALLDLSERFGQDLSHCLVFETGGMKGRRKEITRKEVQDILKDKINVKTLFSEYGMTELLSQAYAANGNGLFKCPPWMKVMGRDITDPLKKGLLSETGGINVIDLANWQTISFIETEDLGRVYQDGAFEVLGRMDNSDLRGCNLMIQ